MTWPRMTLTASRVGDAVTLKATQDSDGPGADGGSGNSEDLGQVTDRIPAGGVHAPEFPLLLFGELGLLAS